MDYAPNDDQRAILGAVGALLARHAGAARAIELAAKEAYDQALDDALRGAGFVDVARGEDTGPLEAALVCEAIAAAAGVVSYGASALVVPGVLDGSTAEPLPGPVALTTVEHGAPVRFGAKARTWLVLDVASDTAWIASLAPGDSMPSQTSFGYPVGSFPEALAQRCRVLPAGSAERLASWWRVALAVEAAGTMRAALACTVAYLKERRQFGRAIGSFQAVQHRLADCAIEIEASRWLAYEAAYQGASTEAAATAAAYALATATRVFGETHQLTGAIGFTREHDLHVFTMRLQALRLELGGIHAHRRALASARWGFPVKP
jgi:alkylation response protein AidB-like acyl-CoA dehydrogenase